jgi:hypothetical protein
VISSSTLSSVPRPRAVSTALYSVLARYVASRPRYGCLAASLALYQATARAYQWRMAAPRKDPRPVELEAELERMRTETTPYGARRDRIRHPDDEPRGRGEAAVRPNETDSPQYARIASRTVEPAGEPTMTASRPWPGITTAEWLTRFRHTSGWSASHPNRHARSPQRKLHTLVGSAS